MAEELRLFCIEARGWRGVICLSHRIPKIFYVDLKNLKLDFEEYHISRLVLLILNLLCIVFAPRIASKTYFDRVFRVRIAI